MERRQSGKVETQTCAGSRLGGLRGRIACLSPSPSGYGWQQESADNNMCGMVSGHPPPIVQGHTTVTQSDAPHWRYGTQELWGHKAFPKQG